MMLAVERAVVQRLAGALAPLPVDALPARGYRFTHAKGAAVVLAAGLTAGGAQDTHAAVQTGALTLEVVLFARSLRDGTGVWALFEAARLALLSLHAAPGVSPLRLADARLADAEGDAWQLVTHWVCQVPLIPDLEYDGGPLLKVANFEDV